MLWGALRNSQVEGLRFRRQHAMADLVVDFYCAEKGLCIEVDAAVYDSARAARDARRTAVLEARGCRVLRFREDEVLNTLHLVVRTIREAVRQVH